MENAKIIWPAAEDLELGADATDWTLQVFMVPGAEITFETNSGCGNIGTPAPAWHRLWLSLGGFAGNVVGTSLLAALRECEDEILAANAGYKGDRWDGSNYVGEWSECSDIELRDVEHYWDSAEWFQGGASDWASLARGAGVDPERTDDKTVEQVAEDIDASALCDGQHVCSIEFIAARRDEFVQALEIESGLTFITPPSCGGQMATYSYACNETHVFQRVSNSSDRTTVYERMKWAEWEEEHEGEEWDPINAEPSWESYAEIILGIDSCLAGDR